MGANMSHHRISDFGTQSLANDYFTIHDTECSICLCAESVGIGNKDATSKPDTAIVKLDACDHIYHKTCLSTWVSRIKNDMNVTCPMCRQILVQVEVSSDSHSLSNGSIVEDSLDSGSFSNSPIPSGSLENSSNNNSLLNNSLSSMDQQIEATLTQVRHLLGEMSRRSEARRQEIEDRRRQVEGHAEINNSMEQVTQVMHEILASQRPRVEGEEEEQEREEDHERESGFWICCGRY
jgi:hypothetical protein